ncbi:triphosphoribosyl-dephospho-CoA synthase [Propionivibrio dicarboxylicus]|uniref:triphosphoribosyl-dephospho-CoA synthase n=1 Tax=Propionivibrio dicarboxylicus TaxID=83767 RepID=A0A1G8LR99_9RHOO|nr:triphosphoribosyl-dephospho-CoA synthase [Propionivibrio dicarboxylicus]SDI58196.1 triphosphoribosyl-dephospho-CoA synthase [Propionivibrio dicarboxylicus]
MNSSRISALERLAAGLVEGARRELMLTPKPGLVDCRNTGSHPDLSLALMEESIDIVADFVAATVASLIRGEPFECQKDLGIVAEQRLYAELGTNTHKGFIFLAGMLLIARWHTDADDETQLRETLSQLSIRFFRTAPVVASNGQRVREAYQAQGIIGETAAGMPALFDVALPAFRAAMRRHGDVERASFAMMARLMQCVEDTTTLHRVGPLGLHRLKKDGQRLERLIADGGDYLSCLEALDHDYIRMNMTMGGVADMIGMSFGVLLACGELDRSDSVETSAQRVAMVG